MKSLLPLIVLTCAGSLFAAETEPRAARSVHLGYAAPPGTIFYAELTVEASTTGSYFMACGFKHGYFGIQELMPGEDKVVLFSVWDPGDQNDPNRVANDERVEVLHRADDVRVGRFGGEGTGGQSFFTYPWKIGETCRFLVQATTNANKTAFAAWFYLNDRKEWKHRSRSRPRPRANRSAVTIRSSRISGAMAGASTTCAGHGSATGG